MSRGNVKKSMTGVAGLAPQARTASANGASTDLSGYLSAIVILDVGVITDGTHTPKLQECDDNATWTDVAAADLEGAFAALATGVNQYVGYKGRKRYLRAVVTVTGGPATGGIYGAVIMRAQAIQA
jgi:hypothetical protein